MIPTLETIIQFGDCDEAGIVFYPRYYAWFDECTHALLAGVGLGHDVLRERYRLTGAPLVQAAARFGRKLSVWQTRIRTAEGRDVALVIQTQLIL